MTAIATTITTIYRDSVEFRKSDRTYVVTRVLPDMPERSTIKVEIHASAVPRYTGSLAWGTAVEIVRETVRPMLDRLMALDGV